MRRSPMVARRRCSGQAAARQSVLSRLAGAGSAGLPVAMPIFQQEQQRFSPMTPEEATAAGYRPGTVVSRNALGGVQVNQQSDAMSPERFQQGCD